MNRLIHLKQSATVFLVALLVVFGFLLAAQAVSPPPDGGYPNFTTAEGDHALQALTTGVGNTAVGTFSLFSVFTGNFNTAVGAGSLDLNQADSNTATGAAALLFNTTGTENTANGTAALEFNDTGNNNTALGAFALLSNTGGIANTATGREALVSNTEGGANTADGAGALFSNITGISNTANGTDALFSNTTGGGNTADGDSALNLNTQGQGNTAIGFHALLHNTTGNGNVALGNFAGNNIATANNVISIGSNVLGADVANSCYIGNIFSQPGGSQAVYVNGDGKLGAQVSSRRFKEEIKPMDKVSEALYALQPVSFRYKKEIDRAGTSQVGLVAEDVEKVNPDLVIRDKDGKPFTVRYDQVNAMLLNEFLKEHRTVQEMKKGIAAFTATLKQQAAQIQKVSAQLKLNKSAPQTVLNNR